MSVNTGYIVNDGNGGNNYTVALNTAAGQINKASLTMTVIDTGGVYTSNQFAVTTATVTGVGGDGTLAGLNPNKDVGTLTYTYLGINGTTYGPSGTAPTNFGSYQVVGHYASDNNNYLGCDSPAVTFNITKATPTVTVSGSAAFDGKQHSAIISIKGVGGASVGGGFTVTYNGSSTQPTAAGTYSVVVTFTSSDPNYSNTTGTGSFTITSGTVSTTKRAASPPSIVGGAIYFTQQVTILNNSGGTLAAGQLALALTGLASNYKLTSVSGGATIGTTTGTASESSQGIGAGVPDVVLSNDLGNGQSVTLTLTFKVIGAITLLPPNYNTVVLLGGPF